jgi:membrane protein implicated in regulation of membrane protease activity
VVVPDLQRNPQTSVALDDSGAGVAMFVIFIAAVLIVTCAVALVALVDTWWILGIAYAIHVLMTTVVMATIVSVMNGRGSAESDRAPAEGRRQDALSPMPIRPLTAK